MTDRPRLAGYLRLFLAATAAAALVVPTADAPRAAADADERVVVHTAAELADAVSTWDPEPGGEGRRVVHIPEGVRIDLGELTLPLVLNERLTLESTRGGLRRGAELYLDETAKATAIDIRGTDVVVQDLRLRGPSSSTSSDQDSLWAIKVRTELEVTISGNEISDWPGLAVQVYGQDDGETCRKGGPPTVRVVGNYIHHNQKSPVGYGVQVSNGGFALVEGNTFDWNRHAIAGNGRSGSGYYARWNYVLSGGSKYPGFLGTTYYNQHFDMHGTGKDGFFGFAEKDGYGGIAGDYVSIWGNTFHGAQKYGGVAGVGRKTRPAYFLRGRPCRLNSFRGNVLWHDGFSEAVRLHFTARDGVAAASNYYDTDTSWDVAVGDFDRDGRDDLFQAAGAAWYYSSGAFTEWRLLQGRRYERIAELRFGDFDRDGRTDVFTAANGAWWFSPGGRGEWRRLASSSAGVGSLGFGDFDGDRRTDVFRASGSRWWFSRGGTGSWQPLATSQLGIDRLRFGNFDGDRRTDVLAYVAGRWSVSEDARSSWEPLPGLAAAGGLGGDPGALSLADFDGNGRTDVAWTRTGDDRLVQWIVAPDGVRAPRVLRSFTRVSERDRRALLEHHWLGGFDGERGADAARYEVRTVAGFVFEGPAIMKTSGGSGYYTHRGIGMR